MFFFCKKNKKAPLAHLITCVVERPELEVPDVAVCVSSLEIIMYVYKVGTKRWIRKCILTIDKLLISICISGILALY